MITLLDLPSEILELILTHLNINELNSVCLTCKNMYYRFNLHFVNQIKSLMMLKDQEFEDVKHFERINWIPLKLVRLRETYFSVCYNCGASRTHKTNYCNRCSNTGSRCFIEYTNLNSFRHPEYSLDGMYLYPILSPKQCGTLYEYHGITFLCPFIEI